MPVVAALNGEIRASLTASMGGPGIFSIAKVNPREIPGFSVMVAGYVAGEPGVLSIDDEGQSDLFHDELPRFLGPYGSTARVAWEALSGFVPDVVPSDPDTLHKFMDLICEKIVGLFTPVDLEVIVPGGGRVS